MDPKQLERTQRLASDLITFTHCIAREPVQRWPAVLRIPTNPFYRGLEVRIQRFEEYREIAVNIWNVITDLPNQYRSRLEFMSMPQNKQNPDVKSQKPTIQDHASSDRARQDQETQVLESLETMLRIATTELFGAMRSKSDLSGFQKFFTPLASILPRIRSPS